ncbi:MAG: hypothetical protein HXX14_18440 [Bacteroidetes bacterium]|nr:hypothetical protein [Bacteroidota bacterium]
MKNYILFNERGTICSLITNWIVFFFETSKGHFFQLKKILIILFIFFFFGSISGQTLPSSDPPNLPQRGRNGNENAAPIGDGTFYLIGFGLAYIAVKIIQANKKELLNDKENEITN